MRANLGFEPMYTPTGTVHSAPSNSAAFTRRKCDGGAAQQVEVVFARKFREFAHYVIQRYGEAGKHEHADKISEPLARRLLFRRGKCSGGAARAGGERKREPIDERTQQQTIQANDESGAAKQAKQRGVRRTAAFHLLKFEFIGPTR